MDKASDRYNQQFSELSDLSNFIGKDKEKKKEVRDFLLKFHICDPAVGSGHFLVSALNVLLGVFFNLRLIYTDNGELLNNFVDIEVGEDEVVVTDESGNPYIYFPHKQTTQRIQKAIFETKKAIIENSLFGVDCNEKSVQICRLRLWIELLKFAYYTVSNGVDALQTMPNIDINIKRGNSLVNRYDISLGKAAKSLPDDLKSVKKLIKDYKETVKNYQNDANKFTKQKLDQSIISIKQMIGVSPQREMDFGEQFAPKGDKEIKTEVLKQSFEWMLEFPAVLDEKGNFLGFDVVLVNPPYIDSELMEKTFPNERIYYRKYFSVTKGNWDIYIPFLERCFQLLSKNGYCSCITPDKWLTKTFGDSLRTFLAPHLLSITRFGRSVFENALIDAIVTKFCHKTSQNCVFGDYEDGSVSELNRIATSLLSSTFDQYFVCSETLKIGNSLKKTVSSLAQCESACATSDCYLLKSILSDNENFNDQDSFKVVNTGTLSKFTSLWGQKTMTYLGLKLLHPIVDKSDFKKIFSNKSYLAKTEAKKLIIKGLTKLDCILDNCGHYVPGKSTVVVLSDDLKILKLLLAFINSSFAIAYLKRRFAAATYNGGLNFTKDIIGAIPLPELKDNQEQHILSAVDEILKDGVGTNNERWSKLDKYIADLYHWKPTMT